MRTFWWTLAILAFLIFWSAVTSYIFIDDYVEGLIHKNLKEKNIEFKGIKYQGFIENISLDIIGGNLNAENIKFYPAAFSDSLGPEGIMGQISIKSLNVEGFKLWNFIISKELHFEKIEITEPSFEAYLYPGQPVEEGSSKPEKSKTNLPSILVNDFKILNASANVESVIGKDSIPVFSVNSLSHSYTLLKLINENDTMIFPSFKTAEFTGNGLRGKMSGYQNFLVDSFAWTSRDSIFNLYTLQVQPTISPEQHRLKLEYQDDWFAVDVDMMKLFPFDPIHYVKSKRFDLSYLRIFHPKAIFYRDVTLPRKDQFKVMPSTKVSNIPLDIEIGSVEIYNGHLTYREKFNPEKKTMDVTFEDLKTKIGPIKTKGQGEFSWEINALILGTIPFSSTVNFGVVNGEEIITATGSLKNVMFIKLNPLMTSIAPVVFTEGIIHEMNFSFVADSDTSSGIMDLEYENLKLYVTKVSKGHTRSQSFLTFAANTLIRTSNLKNRESYKMGHIFAKRNSQKSFFNYFWRSIESGLISSFGNATFDQKKRKKETGTKN